MLYCTMRGGRHGTLLCELRRAQYNGPRQSTMIRGIATPATAGGSHARNWPERITMSIRCMSRYR
ncbi:hypothetical protein CBM2599_A150263 [Cupriavidus taiwanensis]|nr:hypothetical protein CBM2599_A150263 [Cupriavidus taiwanensis]